MTDEARVTVTVNPVNDAPTIKVDAVESITEDAVNTDTVVATLTVRDTDTPEDQLAVSLKITQTVTSCWLAMKSS